MKAVKYRLGLDLGANSLGWAVIGLNADNQPSEILLTGVRIFDAGVEGVIEQGKDGSRAVVRRNARMARRQTFRRQARKRKLFEVLQGLKLLPASEESHSAARKVVFDELDAVLSKKFLTAGDHDAHQKLPYILRDKATTEKLEAFELGRAIYHLAQRRGYKSNRKGQGGDDEEQGVVLGSISEMDDKLKKEKLPLGAYLNRKIKPVGVPGEKKQDAERIRRRWLSREQYKNEFVAIREKQSKHFKKLTTEDWDEIQNKIFFQRPLRSQRHLIGRCELEKDKKKKGLRNCAIAAPIAQEFRLLQKLNDIRVTTPTRFDDPLNATEREKIYEALQEAGEMKWSKVRTLLKLPKGSKINFEEWDDKIIGNRTNAKLAPIFGAKWYEMSDAQRHELAMEILYYQSEGALKKRAINAWKLDEEKAHQLAHKVRLEEGYSSHSKKALEKLVNGFGKAKGMKDGEAYSSVRLAVYPQSFSHEKAVDFLPPVIEWKDDIRNPAVIRAISELRKIVNAIVKKFGKPQTIHLELARDLKNSRKRRKEIFKNNSDNAKRREKAIKEILAETGRKHATRNDVEKWQLAEECNFQCPYCGNAINKKKLLGDDATYNIEHIYPRRYLDDSYINKTIACRKCNDEKGNRTPEQAFSGEPMLKILQRVEKFNGIFKDAKLARFKSTPSVDEFVARQLNDARYNSKLGAQFLCLLFGGRTDEQGMQRVILPTGQLTGKLRAQWQLNTLLGQEDNDKERGDHRHHAIDAVVIGLIDQKVIMNAAIHAGMAEKEHLRHFMTTLQWPWLSFKNDVAYSIEGINVSFRCSHSLGGPLHAETIYSKNFGTEKKPEHRVRKELRKLTAKEISGDQIVDPDVRAVVQAKWELLGRPLPSKVWATLDDVDNFPVLPPSEARLERDPKAQGTIIRKVRLKTDAKPRAVGAAEKERNLASGKDSNYASMVYAVLDEQGNEVKWEHEIIDRLTAHRSYSENSGKKGEKVLIPKEDKKRKFKFALRRNDVLELDGPDGTRQLYRVQNVSKGEIQLCEQTTPVVTLAIRNSWNRISSIDSLRKRNAQKVKVQLTGEVQGD